MRLLAYSFLLLSFQLAGFPSYANDYWCVGLDGHEDLSKPALLVKPTEVPQRIGTIKGNEVSFSVQNNETLLGIELDPTGKDLLTVGGGQGIIRFHNYREGINIDCVLD